MSWTQMDMRLAGYAEELRAIGVPEEFLQIVATSVLAEIRLLDDNVLKEKFPAHYPDAASVNDQIIYNLTFTEQQFHLIYSDDAVNRTAMLATNYLCFVYAHDTYLKSIRSVAPKRGPSRPIAEFLTSGEVRSFRHAFAHGRWCYVNTYNSVDIQYLKDGKEGGEIQILDQRKLVFWQLLSRTVLIMWSARIVELRQPFSKVPE